MLRLAGDGTSAREIAQRLSIARSFKDSRAGECVARHLSGYRGIVQVDGYAAYNKLIRSDRGNDGVTLAGCWSHSRRKFYELHASESSKVATETVERMVKLWQVEETVRGQSPDARIAVREQTSAMIVTELFALWHKTLPRICGKSKLAEAIRYAISRRAIFERFLTDGRIELDSDIVERPIRPQAKHVSLCTPYSSICKHWKGIRVSSATRRPFRATADLTASVVRSSARI